LTGFVSVMTNKPIVYSRQPSETLIPLTARIEWSPCGEIKPLMYWTPDGSCYGVKQVYESTKIAFLKDNGVGIRFRLRAELLERPDYETPYFRHETYLYFADNRFSEKGFIDERYDHGGKKYITVTIDVFPDGDYEPVYFRVDDKRYMVERTLEVEPRGSFRAGGIGVWHKVEARLINDYNDECPEPFKSVRRTAALFWELNKWFVVVGTD